MPRIEISDEVLEFLARRIETVPHLETLLLFWEGPEIAWTATEIAARVYVSRDTARTILQELAKHGFIAPQGDAPDQYRYQRAWDEASLMPRVADAYRRHLVPVTDFLHAKAASSSVHEFARAFKFTNKE